MLSLSVGPLAIPLGQLLFAIAFIVALLTGAASARRQQQKVSQTLWDGLLIGIVTARVAFVVRYYPDYASDWLDIIDIRDQGFLPIWGVSASIFFWGWKFRSSRNQRVPLFHALAAGVLTWSLTAGLLLVIDKTSTSVPNIELATMDNKNQNLQQFVGQPMVVNLWATWCPPCRREMPVLAAAQAEYDDITFVFANQGESGELVNQYLHGESLVLDNVFLDRYGKLAQAVGSAGMPTTLFYDASGRLVDVHLGELSKASLRRAIEQFD